MDRENEEKKKENLEVEIFGGEKKNVKGKGGIYFKREYSFLRRRRKGGGIFGRGYMFCVGKEKARGKRRKILWREKIVAGGWMDGSGNGRPYKRSSRT